MRDKMRDGIAKIYDSKRKIKLKGLRRGRKRGERQNMSERKIGRKKRARVSEAALNMKRYSMRKSRTLADDASARSE